MYGVKTVELELCVYGGADLQGRGEVHAAVGVEGST